MRRISAARQFSPKNHTPESDLPGKFLTISNLLSLIRFALAAPFVVVMLSDIPEKRMWGGGIMIAAALTDKFDGVLARKLHQTSDWGRILDPLADKVAVAATIIVLLLLGDLPVWFVGLTLGRDIAILLGGMLLRESYGLLLPSNQLGKWTVGVISAVLFLILVGIPDFVSGLLLLGCSLLMILSLVSYGRRALEVIGAAGESS